eukprot:GFUD01082645.1.p1 GENE.GFUD01082645.1~~GFUD01082645.1.p1  ORF type:complete len:331 (+),score=73.45 GFUD01082645.1:43-1035(+)
MMMDGAHLLLLFSLVAMSTCYDGTERDLTGCPKRFEQRCSCGLGYYSSWKPDRRVFITNCSNSGFTNPDIIEYTPVETEVLIFNGNQFETLPCNLLGIWNEKLEVLDLTNNGIKEIQGTSFHAMNNIRRLILNHNDINIVYGMSRQRIFSNFENIEELHLSNAFTDDIDFKWYLTDLKDVLISSELKKLKKLHLEQNEIWEIKDNDMFCKLPELMNLHLGDNQLSDINFSLSCLKNLRYLGLEFNKIRNLGQDTLDKLDKAFGDSSSGISQIDLHGNSFMCDCNITPLYNWLKLTKAQLVNEREMRCYDGFPAYNARIRIVNAVELDCIP